VNGPKLYIFDADGTLRWTTVPGQKYPLAQDQWRLMPGVAERLRAIPWSPRGPWLGIASNQSGVASGELSEATARLLIDAMLVAALGSVPAGARVELCTCREGEVCTRHKPEPGMLLSLLRHFGVAARDALYVGDLDIDAEAARRAGIGFAHARDFFG
jgi:HAD superfamily hydrolase (TIGR01662 family)